MIDCHLNLCPVSSAECRLRPSYPDHAPEVRFSTKINLGISGMSQRARGSLESHGKAPVLVQPITCLTWKKMGQWRFLQSCLLVDHSSFKHPAYIVWAPGANVDVTVSLGQKGFKVTSHALRELRVKNAWFVGAISRISHLFPTLVHHFTKAQGKVNGLNILRNWKRGLVKWHMRSWYDTNDTWGHEVTGSGHDMTMSAVHNVSMSKVSIPLRTSWSSSEGSRNLVTHHSWLTQLSEVSRQHSTIQNLG